MKKHAPFASVVVLSIMALVATGPSVQGGGVVSGTLGPVWVGGTTYSGGTNLFYQLNVTAFAPGALLAQAQVKGKGWKATFPLLTTLVNQGDSVVNGTAVMVPPGFQGPATLKIRATLNGARLGKRSIAILIGPPPPPVAGPASAIWYDVGFNTNVILNADMVATAGLVAPLTYSWSILDTDIRTNAQLTGANTASPVLRTLPLTSFDIDLDKQFDLGTVPNLVGIDAEQVDRSTYHLRVIVTDAAAQSVTGLVTVISTSVSPGQPSLPIGERQYFTAMPNGTNVSTYVWTLSARPPGSTAVLENPNTRTPSLRPDREGAYALQLSVRSAGVTNTSYVTVRGASYVGVATCAQCHGPNPLVGLSDIHTPWSQTKHAIIARRGVDGLLTGTYSQSCLACHTLGYDPNPRAVNGGFDEEQAATGWQIPTVLQTGNFAVMPPMLRNLANVQCESCHGPGSQHPGPDSTTLDVAACATCHQNGGDYNRPLQWRISPHGNDDDYLSASVEEAPNPNCAKCHSPTSFVDFMRGKPLTRLEAGRLTCQGCHDPHNEAMYPPQAHMVRIYNDVTLDDTVLPASPPVLTGQGTSALCMFCHNARRSPPATFSTATTLPHGGSTATDVLLGIRASTNVQVVVAGVTNTIASVQLQNSAHATVAKCVDCHMHKAGVNTVGDHTFSVVDRVSGQANLAACNVCHAGVDPVTDLDHIPTAGAGDWDGDGVVEGVQSEVDGVMSNLVAKMTSTGMTLLPSFPYWSGYATSNPTLRAAQRNAAWNHWMIRRDLSRGVHNTAFTVRLLQWSYTVLSTNTTPPGNPYWVDFPAADIR